MGLGTAPAMQDGRIYIEKINGPFLSELKGTPAEYRAYRGTKPLPELIRRAEM